MLKKNQKFGFLALGLVAIIGFSKFNNSEAKQAENSTNSVPQITHQQLDPTRQTPPNQQHEFPQQSQFNTPSTSNKSHFQQIQSAPYNQQPTSTQNMSPQQFMVGNWGLQTQHGTVVGQYMPNGLVMGVYQGVRDRQPRQFKGKWSVKPLGNGRFSLTVAVAGQKPEPNIMRMLPDGNLMNETYKAIAYRMPTNQRLGY